MKFSTAALSAFVLAGGATAFTQKSTTGEWPKDILLTPFFSVC
jgi:hypothetical protein